MVAANFVVITNGGGARLLEQPISTNSVPRLSFRELRLVVDYLEGSLSVAT